MSSLNQLVVYLQMDYSPRAPVKVEVLYIKLLFVHRLSRVSVCAFVLTIQAFPIFTLATASFHAQGFAHHNILYADSKLHHIL